MTTSPIKKRLTGRASHLIGVAVLVSLPLTGARPALAQAPFDANAYRAAKQLATTTFLDRTRPVQQRLAAADGLHYPEEATFVALLVVLASKLEPDAIRLKAGEHARFDIKYVDAVLDILATPNNGKEVLRAGLIHQIMSRTSLRLPTKLVERIEAGVRDRLTDTSAKVRLAAFQTLVAKHDPAAISLVVAAVQKGTKLPIPLADALALLELDGPAKHVSIVRPYLTHADPLVRAQAVRVLATDPQSQPAVVKLAINPQTPVGIRTNALRALASEDASFDYAIDLVEGREHGAEVRYQAMKAYAGRMNYRLLPEESQARFARVVLKLSSEEGLRSLDGHDVAGEAGKLVVYLGDTFPNLRSSGVLP